MRQLQITPSITSFQSANLPQLGILTHIEELTKHDLIYCFHQLKIGEELSLERDYNRFWDENATMVYYKNHKIGYLSPKTASMIARHLNRGNIAKISIKNVLQNKFSPFQNIDVQITIHNPFDTLS
jgi:hypothetical protein